MSNQEVPNYDKQIIPATGTIVPAAQSDTIWAVAKPESRSTEEILDLHEASGVEIHFDPNIVEGQLHHATRQRIYHDDDNFTPSFLFLRDAHSPILANLQYDDGNNQHISIGSNRLNEWLWNLDDTKTPPQPYETDEPVDINILEQFVGRTFIRVGDNGVNKYILSSNTEIDKLGNIQRLFLLPSLTSPILNGGDPREITEDPMLDHVFDKDRYIITGQSGPKEVSRSTLAIIDAGIQVARLTGETSLPLSVVLAQIYDPELFCEDLEKPYYDRQYRSTISNQAVLQTILSTWTTEMGIETDNLLRTIEDDIYELLQVRQLNLDWLMQEYGQVNTVRKIVSDNETSIMPATNTLPILPDPETLPSGSELLARLSEAELHNLGEYSRIVLDTIETYSLLYAREEVAPIDILGVLESEGVITSDIARTHADEFIGLITEYQTLLIAKQSMEKSGLDTSSMEVAFHAKLIEFVARNAAAVQRTNILAPEIGMNLDTMLTIVERTGMHGRATEEMVSVLGRMAAAKEQIEAAIFPELTSTIRKQVVEDMGIEQLPVPSFYDDNSGATFYVSREEDANGIAHVVGEILSTSHIMVNEIPVEVEFKPEGSAKSHTDGKFAPAHWVVSIGTSKQRSYIPEQQRLEEGPRRYHETKTGGH